MEGTRIDIPDFVEGGGYGDVSGHMSIPGSVGGIKGEDYNTLDEPVRATIMRDLRAVGGKFYHVLFPIEKKALLKDWDLWGPLLLCTFIAIMVQGSETANNVNDGGPEFAEVFVIVWVGSAIVTVNSKLLGGTISFFQSVCVLGYCLAPCAVALLLCWVLLFAQQSYFLFMLRLFFTGIGFVWSTYSSMVFLGDSQPKGKKALAVYPMFLFYFVISWLIISRSNT